jgi:hypothetical protein
MPVMEEFKRIINPTWALLNLHNFM